MERILLLFIVLFQHSVTAGNSDGRISIFADEMDDVILPLPGGLLFERDQIDKVHRVIWKKGEEVIPSHDGNGFINFEEPRYRKLYWRYYYGSLLLEARSWKDGEEYSAHIKLRDNRQSSIYYRVSAYNVSTENSDNRISIIADEMDDIILQLPEHLWYQIDQVDSVIWKKGEERITSHYGNRFAYFMGFIYSGIFWRSFYDSFKLEARSWKDGEEYSAHISLDDDSQSSVYYRVSAYSVTAGNSDHRISISARETDDVILKLPELLLKQIDRVIWRKGEELIASSYGNGSRTVDPGYKEILNISNDGSLILKARRWEDGEEYSARITLNDNSRSLIYYIISVTSVTAGNSDHRISIFAHKMDDIILPLPGRLLFQIDQIDQIDQVDHIDSVVWKKGEELIPSHDGNGFPYFEGFRYMRVFSISLYDALILKAQSWKDGEEYSAHITWRSKSQSSIYYHVSAYSVTAGNSDGRISIIADEKDDIILQLPENPLNRIDQVDRVIWKKGEELIPSHYGNGFGYFAGFRYRSLFWRPFHSSLMLEARSWKDGEEYSAHIKLRDKSQSAVYYRVSAYSVTAGNSDHRISISAHETDDVILKLPEHLLKQIDRVIWRKGKKLIASSYGNGPLRIEDPGYGEILNISNDGSLIIKARRWEDGEEYSARITLNDNSRSSIYYLVSVTNIEFIPQDTGPKIVNAIIGENLTLLWESDLDKSEIVQIDWLTDKWNYFASTKVEGDIRIVDSDYVGYLNSTKNGSLVFQRVTKDYNGKYRACIFSYRGQIVENNFQVRIADHFEADTSSLDAYLDDDLVFASMCIFIIIINIMFIKTVRSMQKENKPSSPPGKEKELLFLQEKELLFLQEKELLFLQEENKIILHKIP